MGAASHLTNLRAQRISHPVSIPPGPVRTVVALHTELLLPTLPPLAHPFFRSAGPINPCNKPVPAGSGSGRTKVCLIRWLSEFQAVVHTSSASEEE